MSANYLRALAHRTASKQNIRILKRVKPRAYPLNISLPILQTQLSLCWFSRCYPLRFIPAAMGWPDTLAFRYSPLNTRQTGRFMDHRLIFKEPCRQTLRSFVQRYNKPFRVRHYSWLDAHYTESIRFVKPRDLVSSPQ